MIPCCLFRFCNTLWPIKIRNKDNKFENFEVSVLMLFILFNNIIVNCKERQNKDNGSKYL